MTSAPSPEQCPGCQFVWDDIDPATVSARIRTAVSGLAEILSGPHATERPEPQRWSSLEYAAHVRDVLLNVRDRIILAFVEECPSPPPIYREHRVALGLYANDGPEIVAGDLAVAARLFTTAFDAISPEHGARPLIYSQLLKDERTINWTGAQGVHECEHHLGDARENAHRLET